MGTRRSSDKSVDSASFRGDSGRFRDGAESGGSGARRSPKKRRAILDAAVAELRLTGYAAVTVEKVAARAGVGKQTIYRWWPGKPALFVEVYGDLVPAADLRPPRPETGGRAALDHLFGRLAGVYADGLAPAVLAGLIADAQADAAAEAALRDGLTTGRADLLFDPLFDLGRAGALAPGLEPEDAQEILIARLWFRVLTDRRGLTAGFLRGLVAPLLRAPQGGGEAAAGDGEAGDGGAGDGEAGDEEAGRRADEEMAAELAADLAGRLEDWARGRSAARSDPRPGPRPGTRPGPAGGRGTEKEPEA